MIVIDKSKLHPAAKLGSATVVYIEGVSTLVGGILSDQLYFPLRAPVVENIKLPLRRYVGGGFVW